MINLVSTEMNDISGYETIVKASCEFFIHDENKQLQIMNSNGGCSIINFKQTIKHISRTSAPIKIRT